MFRTKLTNLTFNVYCQDLLFVSFKRSAYLGMTAWVHSTVEHCVVFVLTDGAEVKVVFDSYDKFEDFLETVNTTIQEI